MGELLAASVEDPGALYGWMKFVHVLGMVIYVGGLLTLTRVLGRAIKFETAESRADTLRTFKRMHKFVDWGGLGMMLVAGLWLLIADPAHKAYMKQGYFHIKLTAFVALLVCDALLTMKLFRLKPDGPAPSANFFRILHGIAGLALIAALIAVFVVRG